MKSKHIIILMLIVFSISSCKKLLEEKPYGTFSENNYYTTEKDAFNALLYAYDPINNIEYGSRFLFNIADVPTNQYNDYGRGFPNTFYSWDVNSNTEEFLYFFKYAYLGISRANSVLANVSAMNNISQTSRKQFLGEAHFLRAFHYFNLVRTYGSVPLHSKVVESIEDAGAPYASIPDIYAFIVKDLEDAILLLGISKQQGRADKVAAQATLAKVYLTLASSKLTGASGYEWVQNAEEMYTLSTKYAGDVLYNQSVYALDSDLLNVYDVKHQADSKEHIFITSMYRDAKGEEGNFSQLPQLFGIGLPQIYVSSSISGGAGVNKFINNTACWSYYRVDKDFYNSYASNDRRKKLMVSTIYNANGSVLANWIPTNVTSSNPTENAFFYPFCRKYTDPESLGTRTSANLYLIRFAEVALTYAEAVGPTLGYEWVNKIRQRANADPLTPGLNISDFRKAIWKEKSFELAFEGHGIYELRRTNRVIEEITNKTVKTEYAYFYPIPQRETDINPKK
ncbi:RagB/SusD family nutrient uptake outer membrane protein [Pedobacter cryophilus]|uniref:RagB/SusD family nutrient uptake outer membrane protein n=1 Tax=Pedobacter cryophilus TaxID=2571271 RepID=A0A4U1BXU7_9SPHI|nr:RagB/SusD family nutrient uptake outer membrane protein [Pedobacter cryophilus]TKB96376.1 RagB/SusD family nutrient uptake outer membrane protein [Pedobacter cryophilus]